MSRLRAKDQEKQDKLREQQEYQRMFQENYQREIANEMAYKKRFQDFGRNLDRKDRQYYEIVNNNDFKRDMDVKKISGVDKMSFYDYYDQREKDKMKKAGELKESSYKDMKNTIDKNYRNIQEVGRQRREDAQRSAQELQQFLDDEKQRKANERVMQQQYRGILEAQVKIKKQHNSLETQIGNEAATEIEAEGTSLGEMYMVPGINSVSPYLKKQRKGEAPLGEHLMKMK